LEGADFVLLREGMDFLYGKFHAMPRIVTAWQRVSSPCFLRELVGSGGNSHSQLTYDRLCSPLQSCPSLGKPLSSVPPSGVSRAERMQALRDAPPFSITGLSTLANSLQIPCSLLKIPC
jgi:hypothetical protein